MGSMAEQLLSVSLADRTLLGGGIGPVILFAEPPLHAEIKMRSSIMLSLILLLPDCTTKTSFSRILVKILTLVSPCGIGQPHRPTGRLHRIYICELRELDSSWGHAQIRAYLIRERRA
jgi:hypothetical protein